MIPPFAPHHATTTQPATFKLTLDFSSAPTSLEFLATSTYTNFAPYDYISTVDHVLDANGLTTYTTVNLNCTNLTTNVTYFWIDKLSSGFGKVRFASEFINTSDDTIDIPAGTTCSIVYPISRTFRYRHVAGGPYGNVFEPTQKAAFLFYSRDSALIHTARTLLPTFQDVATIQPLSDCFGNSCTLEFRLFIDFDRIHNEQLVLKTDWYPRRAMDLIQNAADQYVDTEFVCHHRGKNFPLFSIHPELDGTWRFQPTLLALEEFNLIKTTNPNGMNYVYCLFTFDSTNAPQTMRRVVRLGYEPATITTTTTDPITSSPITTTTTLPELYGPVRFPAVQDDVIVHPHVCYLGEECEYTLEFSPKFFATAPLLDFYTTIPAIYSLYDNEACTLSMGATHPGANPPDTRWLA